MPSPNPDRYLRFGLASWQGRPSLFEGFHRHNEIELLLVESGRLTFLFGRGRVELAAESFAVFWGAMPHKLIARGPGTHSHWLTLPLPWFLQWGLPGGLCDAVMHGAVVREPEAARFAADRALFRQWHADLKGGQTERGKTALLEIEARLRRLALAAEGKRAKPLAGRGASGAEGKIERMAACVAERYREPLSVTEIAAAAGLNACYATTLFRRSTGMTLVEYLTEHRLSHAQRLLSTTGRKVLDVALDAGFGSLSRFYEAFGKACGQTPRRFRAGFRSGKLPAQKQFS